MTPPPPLHGPAAPVGDLADRATAWIRDRLLHSPVGNGSSPSDARRLLSAAITEDGLGLDQAWDLFTGPVARNTLGLDSERFLAFIPVSPSVASVWMDAIVGAANFSVESWLEAPGAVAAEEQVIRWLIELAGMPVASGGGFVSGGSLGNLSALAVARERAGSHRRAVVVGDTAHASVANALHLLGMDVVTASTNAMGRLTGDAVRSALGGRSDVAAIVAAGGSTNAGIVDDLAGCADVASEIDAWMHVDGAYGLAAMLLPELRSAFRGIERADSFIVDPHKWLFAPAGSCALVYRNPAEAATVHTQHGPYIDVLQDAYDDSSAAAFNPSDIAFQLTRRASGLPLWFALAVHGVEAHRVGIRHGIALARRMADAITASAVAELVVAPQLGVVLFRRHGWTAADYRAWAADLLVRQVAFVAPSTYRGEPVGRLVFMHPRTPVEIIDELTESMSDAHR
jgi:glutamate/tyrosine decarboxylase-like PLP-dependent enzyme